MRRRRLGGEIIALIVIAVLLAALGATSLIQNLQVRAHFNGLLVALKIKDTSTLRAYYTDVQNNLTMMAEDEFTKHTLYGWRILSVSNQPWPLDATKGYRKVKVELYMDLPPDMMKPRGKYAPLDNSPYGPCAVVPATIEFYYMPDTKHFFLMPPNGGRAENWLCPFTPMVAPGKKE
jgi:hypothetical protein